MTYKEMENIICIIMRNKKYVYQYCKNEKDIQKFDESAENLLEKLQNINSEMFDEIMKNNEF